MMNHPNRNDNEDETGVASSSSQASSFVTQLNAFDVLVGRGAPSIDNPGNIRFRQFIQNRKLEYMSTNKRQIKDGIARQVMEQVEHSRGRFLRKIESLVEAEDLGVPTGLTAYARVEEDAILLKVKQALRGKDRSSGNNSNNPNANAVGSSGVNAAGGSDNLLDAAGGGGMGAPHDYLAAQRHRLLAAGGGAGMHLGGVASSSIGDFHPGVLGAGGPLGAGPMSALARASLLDPTNFAGGGAANSMDLMRLGMLQPQQQQHHLQAQPLPPSLHNAAMLQNDYFLGGMSTTGGLGSVGGMGAAGGMGGTAVYDPQQQQLLALYEAQQYQQQQQQQQSTIGVLGYGSDFMSGGGMSGGGLSNAAGLYQQQQQHEQQQQQQPDMYIRRALEASLSSQRTAATQLDRNYLLERSGGTSAAGTSGLGSFETAGSAAAAGGSGGMYSVAGSGGVAPQFESSSPMFGTGVAGGATSSSRMEQAWREDQQRSALLASGGGGSSLLQAQQQQQQQQSALSSSQPASRRASQTDPGRARALSSPDDETAGDRLLRLGLERQANRAAASRKGATSSNDTLTSLTLLEYLTLKVLVARGIPVASPSSSSSSSGRSNPVSPTLWTWGDVGMALRQTATTLQQDRIGRLVLLYTTDTKGLATKTIRLLRRLGVSWNTGTASPVASSLVDGWLGQELTTWSTALQTSGSVAKAGGGASALPISPGMMDTSAGRRSGEPSEEGVSPNPALSTANSTTTVACLDEAACQAILLQIATLTRLRSLSMSFTNVRDMLRSCLLQSKTNVPRWERRPVWWEAEPLDLLRNDVFLLERVNVDSLTAVQPSWFHGAPTSSSSWSSNNTLANVNLDREQLQRRVQELVLHLHQHTPPSNAASDATGSNILSSNDLLLHTSTMGQTNATGRSEAPSLSSHERSGILALDANAAELASNEAFATIAAEQQVAGEAIVPKGPKRKRPKHEQQQQAKGNPKR